MSTSHAANAITSTNISNWNKAYGWGQSCFGRIPNCCNDGDTTNTSLRLHFAIDSITKDSNGHVTKINTKTVTMPSAQSIPSNTTRRRTQLKELLMLKNLKSNYFKSFSRWSKSTNNTQPPYITNNWL